MTRAIFAPSKVTRSERWVCWTWSTAAEKYVSRFVGSTITEARAFVAENPRYEWHIVRETVTVERKVFGS